MRYPFLICFLLLLLSCSDKTDSETCEICISNITLNGSPWEVIDRNVFREGNANNVTKYVIGLQSRYKNGFMVLKDDLSISQIDKKFNDTLLLVDREHGLNPETAEILYTTLKSDGDVHGSSYELDTSFYNYFILEEVTEIYLKARFQARLLKKVGDGDFPWEEDPDVVEFTDGMIIAEREEE